MSDQQANVEAKKSKPSRLGRGLSSLMATPVAVKPEAAETRRDAPPPPPEHSAPADGGGKPEPAEASAGLDLAWLALDAIVPNPHQPRQQFDAKALARLADSIASEGVMQPVVVRERADPLADEPRYELVAGERRWRAARLAGLDRLPAVVRSLDDQQLAEWALVENLQREDLNPMERAEAFRRLAEGFGLSHEEVAQRVGLERSTVTNHLRLLRLDAEVASLVAQGVLSMGQARALAGLDDAGAQRELAKRAVKEEMSVRQVEAAARARQGGETPTKASAPPSGRSAYLDDLERQMRDQLGTKVAVKPYRKKGTGCLSIDFHSLEHFDSLLALLGVKTE